MTTLKPGSMLLGTTRPAELRAWYAKALAPESTGEGAIDLGGFLLVIDGRDDVEAKNDEPGRVIVNFHVDDFDAVEAQLNVAGVEWISVSAGRRTMPATTSGSRSRPATGMIPTSRRAPWPTGIPAWAICATREPRRPRDAPAATPPG